MGRRRTIIWVTKRDKKLSGGNFGDWREYVLAVVIEMKAVDHLISEVERPSGKLSRRQLAYHKRWEAKDARTRGVIMRMMHDDIQYEFEQCLTCNKLWKALHHRFGGNSKERAESVMIALDSYRMNPKHDMTQHLWKMMNMFDELRDAGQTLTEEKKVQFLISSLPASWDHVKIQIERSDRIMTFNEASVLLEVEEGRLNSNITESEAEFLLSRTFGDAGVMGPEEEKEGADHEISHNQRMTSHTENVSTPGAPGDGEGQFQEKYGSLFQMREGFRMVRNYVLRRPIHGLFSILWKSFFGA